MSLSLAAALAALLLPRCCPIEARTWSCSKKTDTRAFTSASHYCREIWPYSSDLVSSEKSPAWES